VINNIFTLSKNIRQYIVFFIVSISIGFCLNKITFAETKITLQNTQSERITDLADIFTTAEENILKNKILEIEQKTQAQIAILTLKTLHNQKINPENLDIFQFGIELVSDKNLGWNIGNEKLDTGLLLIIAQEDHKYRFFTGYGLEGVLPDLRLKSIAEAYFPPSFRQNKYYSGVYSSLVDIQKFLEHDEEIVRKYKKQESEEFSKIAIFLLIAFSFFAGLFVSEVKNTERKNKFVFGISAGILATIFTPYILFNVGLFALFLFLFSSSDKNSSGGFSTGNWSSGGGFGGNSGFSSFGGGSFGGGGFGGDW